MHQTLKAEEVEKTIESEICIVGAGAAGISLALKLNELGHSVLLLESGGFEYDPATQALNDGQSVGQKYFPIESCRLRFFGGTTMHWTGQCSTLDEIDFEEREWVQNSGWPITKADLDPYYKEAHKLCDLQEYEYDAGYWENKLDEKFLQFDKKLARTKIFQKSAPTRFGTKYREKVVTSENIRLLTHANLTQINLVEYGNQVDSLTISTIGGKTHEVRARAFVLACGALQNVRHLLNSNKVMNTGVGNQNDLVGRYFMDQPHLDSADMVLLSHVRMKFYFDYSLNATAFGMFTTSETVQRKLRLQNYSARIISKSEAGSPAFNNDDSKGFLEQWEKLDKRMERINKLRSVLGDKQVNRMLEKLVLQKKEVRFKEVGKLETSRYVFNTRAEQAPNPNSRVDLANTKDAMGIPHVRLSWQLSESDKLSILKSNVIMGSELGRLGVGRLKINDWLLKENIEWPQLLSGGWHHLGVTRMHENPKKGVVDKNCKVHNVNNLFIGGSAVFTTSGVANPTLTIVALALRLANHLDGGLSNRTV